MPSSGMIRRVALVRTDASEELSSSFIKVTRIGKLGTTLAETSNQRTSVLTRATGRNIPEDAVLGSTPCSAVRFDARPPPSHRTPQAQNKRTHNPCLGWDSIPRSQCFTGQRLRP
jgi:hypothetical protein